MDGGKSEREIPSRGVILGIRGWAGYGEGWVSCCCPLTFYDSHYSVSLPTDCCVLSLAGACVKCSKGVFGAGQACQAMGNLYHDACFTCAACSECVGVWGEPRVRNRRTEEGGDGRASFRETLGPCPCVVLREGRTVSSRRGGLYY